MSEPASTAVPCRARSWRGVWLVAALVLGGATASASDNPKEASREFRDAWRQGIPITIRYAMLDLAAFDSPVCVDSLLDVFKTGEPAFFPIARRILAGYRERESVAMLVRSGVGSRSATVRAQSIRALGEGRPTSFDWIVPTRAALGDAVPEVRAAAVAALGRVRDDEALEAIIDLAADPSERVRMEVPEALSRLAGTRALPLLRSLGRDERWRVRLGVINALSDIKTHKSIAALVEQFADEPGRLREDCLTRLQRLTGRTFGLNIERWREFIADPPEDFMARADRAALMPAQYSGGLNYYGIKTLSRRFVLVTDVSGSMSTPVDVRSIYEGTSPRIDITKRELKRLIENLDRDVAFNLVTFSDKAKWWNSSLVPANERNKRNASAVVEKYHASGATNVYEALAFVFDMAEEALDAPIDKAEDVDTLFFLSDGVPTEGTIQAVDLLRDYIAERNDVLQLRIHCLSLTNEVQAGDFLEQVANDSGGRYLQLVAD